MTEEIPEKIALTLLNALIWCGPAIKENDRDAAWHWVDSRRGNVEEMGG